MMSSGCLRPRSLVSGKFQWMGDWLHELPRRQREIRLSSVSERGHVHPAVAPVMERAAVIGGVDGASCILAAKLLGREPSGTVPHAAFLIVGDRREGCAEAYDEFMPDDAPRIILVDTFKDEAEEALRVAEALGKKLTGIRLDTPGERGGVTPDLVTEVRARLDQAGYGHVKIFVSGGLYPEKIQALSQAGAYSFGVGSFISQASAH